jgi:Glycosyltransferase Family 4
VRVALLEHDAPEGDRVRGIELPDLPLRLRKIGDAPGRVPGAFLMLLRGGYDVAHAFTAQDAAVAIAWSRISGAPVVYTQREPLSRANVSDRRLRLATLRLAVERSDAVLAPDGATAESLRRWMAVEPRVIPRAADAEHVELYSELLRR